MAFRAGTPCLVSTLLPSSSELQDALEEQKAYYRARAAEYDEWFLRTGRYNRGLEQSHQWFHEVQQVIHGLESLGHLGNVLELAGGTGLWTRRLVHQANSVTVVDASEEMIEINRDRVGDVNVQYIHDDIYDFEIQEQYDTIFFSFWLSHVPSARFEEFWEKVRKGLKPGGLYFFIDSLKENRSTAVNHHLPDEDDCETLVRKLNDGREFRIFKLFYKPFELEEKLAKLGLESHVTQTDSFFLYGCGRPAEHQNCWF